MITINRNILFPSIWVLSIIVSLCSLFFNANNYFLSFITFLYLVTIPGFLILYSICIKNIDFWSSLLLSVGLSLFFLLIPSVIFNSLWWNIYRTAPLQTEHLTIFYGMMIVILLNIAYFRNKTLQWKLSVQPHISLKKIYFIAPPLLTVMSIFAAIFLNNTGNNILAILSLTGIGISIIATIIWNNKLDEHFFPWSIYFHSLSLLLIISLRSDYVSGWDIQNEFVLFQLTKRLGVWTPQNMNDAYNACLSISMLPAIFSKLTSFPDDYIYKLMYQILFAITPVAIYQLYKRFFSSAIGYIAVIYIISQPLFIQPMTALMRQEIAFIFFALMFWALFNKQFSVITRSILFLCFGSGMIVSHYSTSYVTLLLIIVSYPLVSFFRLAEKIPFIAFIFNKIKIKDSTVHYQYYLNPVIVILLFLFAFIWYGPINNQLGQVKRVATEGLSKMNELFRSDITSAESRQALPFSEKDFTSTGAIQAYVKSQLVQVNGDSYRLYDPVTYMDSDVHPMGPVTVASVVFSKLNKYVLTALEIIKQIFKFGVILGPIYAFVWYFRKSTFSREYIILSGSAVLVIVVMTFHPYFNRQYNLSRFYLQLLFFLSLPATALMIFLFYPLKKYSILIIGIVVSVLFIYLSGLSYHFFGGEARMYLNNFGSDYDKFYVHTAELDSARWLNINVSRKRTLFMDREANLRMYRIAIRGFNYNVLPALIYKDAYVYGSYANVVGNRSSIYTDGASLVYSFPNQFLEENKNVIYNNGGSKIYR
ncbi:hypothetical protein BH09PAT2_BH09PAT2_01440 [soil metagenome]